MKPSSSRPCIIFEAADQINSLPRLQKLVLSYEATHLAAWRCGEALISIQLVQVAQTALVCPLVYTLCRQLFDCIGGPYHYTATAWNCIGVVGWLHCGGN